MSAELNSGSLITPQSTISVFIWARVEWVFVRENQQQPCLQAATEIQRPKGEEKAFMFRLQTILPAVYFPHPNSPFL